MAEHKCGAKVPKSKYRYDWKPCTHKAKFYRISAEGTHIAYTCGIHEKIEYVDLQWEPISVETIDPEFLDAFISRKIDHKQECIEQIAAWDLAHRTTVQIIARARERARKLSQEGKKPAYGTTLLRSDRDKPGSTEESDDVPAAGVPGDD